MSPESRLPARSVLLLRRGVHWTPAPSKVPLLVESKAFKRTLMSITKHP